jgi:hypothetical protein
VYANNDPVNLRDPRGTAVEVYCEYIDSRSGERGSVRGAAAGAARHCFVRAYEPWSGGYDVTLEIYGPDGGPTGRPFEDPTNHDRLSNSTMCSVEGQYPGIEDDVIAAFRELSTMLPNYNPLGPNSNTFVKEILNGAGATVDLPFNAPFNGPWSGFTD